MWAALAAIGRDPSTGGYRRGGWTPTERAATDWFQDQCAARALTLEPDGIGNLIAWWTPPNAGSLPPDTPGSGAQGGLSAGSSATPGGEPAGGPASHPGIVTGSHLDSVIDGGAFDGPLGIVSALAAVDQLRADGFEPSVPIGIGALRREAQG